MNLNTSQLEIVTSQHPYKAIIAGAGSGKTRTLLAAMKHLIDDGVDPGRIAAITFTNVAANELQSRLGASIIGYCGTVHSFMLRAISEKGQEVLGLPPSLTILEETATTEWLKQKMERAKVKFTLKLVDEELRKGPARFYAPASRRLSSIETFVSNLYADMIRDGLVTYDAILQFGLEIVQSAPECFPFDYLFWDEFQDSGDDDAAILHKLPIANKFVVGDPRQSIYSFRGANVANFLKIINNGEFTVFQLQTNYRSGLQIVEAANKLMEYAPTLTEPMLPRENAQDAVLEVYGVNTERDEIQKIIEIIHDSCRNGIPLHEMAILTRSNPVRQKITDAIRASGIAVREIRDEEQLPKQVLSFLAFAASPENEFAATQWLRSYAEINGKEFKELYAEATSKLLSINVAHFRLDGETELEHIPALMAQFGFNALETQEAYRKIQNLRAGSSIADLIAAYREPDAENVTGGITISTIHGSKGREWRVVILPAFEQQEIPSFSLKRNPEEERRIAFVAITRAKDEVHIIHTKSRFNFKKVDCTPSQFIDEAL